MEKAVIYARVSSQKQLREGNGLDSQTVRCRQYAEFQKYEVVAVFTDDISGATLKRPGMEAMMAFLRSHKKEPHRVLIDDISRLARDTYAYSTLRKKISRAGGLLESPSLKFEGGATGHYHENILSASAQFQRELNRERVVSRMHARMHQGAYVLQTPRGYKFEKDPKGGARVVPDEPIASAVREALVGFAQGRLSTQADVKRFLEAHPDYPKPKSGKVSPSAIRRILSNVLYAGMVEYEPWGITLREGRHEGLISYATYLKIQERLEGRTHAPMRSNLGEEFSLRGFVLCDDCGKPMQSCLSKGRSKLYPYYLCASKPCPSYGKSVRREKLEGEFETILKQVQPTKKLIGLATKMFKDVWDIRQNDLKARKQAYDREIKKCDQSIAKLVDKAMETETSSLLSAFEKRIRALESEKVKLTEQRENLAPPKKGFEDSFRTALDFLLEPWKRWETKDLRQRRLVLQLTFSQGLRYCREKGFRTVKKADLALPFAVFGDTSEKVFRVVGPEGLEPPTRPL